MEEVQYKILVVDERSDDIDEVKNMFELAKDFEVFGLDKLEHDDDLFDFIRENEIDAVAIDFKLKELHSSFTKNGDSYLRELLEVFENFPIFILTNNVNDAKSHQIDPFKIIDKDIVAVNMDDEDQEAKALELIDNIRYLINNYRSTLQAKEIELAMLIKKQNSATLNEDELQKMIELDNDLENSISKKLRIPSAWKSPTGLEKLSQFINKTQEIVDELKKLNNE
jgi:DNA-binding NarL/FixJ family response regulator